MDKNVSPRYTICVTKQDEGQRIDKFLSDAVPELTRSRIQQLIEQGHVYLDGQPGPAPSKKVKADQVFIVNIPPSIEPVPKPEDIPLDVIYEDTEIIIINKAAGMVVHPAPGSPSRTLVNALLAHCGDSLSGINGVKRPGIVHRLDKGTSGLMVIAKTDAAHQALSQQLLDKSMQRTYHAITWGVPSPRKGTVKGAIGRSPKNRKKMALVSRGGKEATTHYQVLKTYGLLASLVQCQLETGRTHQIRVHLTSLGHGLVGDPTYGRKPKHVPEAVITFLKGAEWSEKRPALHAYQLCLKHPITGADMSFEAPIPGDIRGLINVLDCLKGTQS